MSPNFEQPNRHALNRLDWDREFPDRHAFDQSESIAHLAAALAQVQGELVTIARDKTATVRTDKGEYTFTYANIASVLEQVLPLTAKHELAISQGVGSGVLTTEIMHSSGEWKRSTMPLPTPLGKATPQSLGSAITYARRYALCALLGVATDDDDGQAARGQGEQQRADQGPKTNRPKLVAAFARVGIGAEDLGYYLGHSVEEITEEEALTLVEWGSKIRDGGEGEEEARRVLTRPTAAEEMERELFGDAKP